ncbi:MAG: PTS sugar transporter subunit IIA [Oscillospiraceae bacterium]|nr:PTS sugar transporter subunit IIA [Oscillospiraceae bacterium]
MGPIMQTNAELVLLNRTYASDQDAIDELANLALKQGFVDESFITAIKKREVDYPTGLDMPVPLAIPHIEDGCKTPFVSVATLREPVNFKSMDQSGDDVKVRVVFLFGIINPKDQLAILRKFAATFADPDALNGLLAKQTPEEFLKGLDAIMEGFLVIN